jgi:hypothetical protein
MPQRTCRWNTQGAAWVENSLWRRTGSPCDSRTFQVLTARFDHPTGHPPPPAVSPGGGWSGPGDSSPKAVPGRVSPSGARAIRVPTPVLTPERARGTGLRWATLDIAKAGPSNIWLPPMFGSRSDHQSRYQGRRAICAVLTLALLMLGLAVSSSGHTHARPSDGWYNAECPLCELTARAGHMSVLSAPPLVRTGLIASGTVHAAAPYVPAAVVLVAGSRAPPLA